ncbi:sugar transferase [Cohnella herbarum]|uniref:Sugar transferase n=1 Tax=Cohnella herbarum TaxID=2728023 RepID=A0A7Z2VQQ1_9BACL|nr:sugar transferase [Cohnella herbarum]QJD87180.1 sugar transferase [Cohnella herbarum]
MVPREAELEIDSKSYYRYPNSSTPSIRIRQEIVKRSLDFVLATLGMFLLLPVFLAVAIAIKLEDPKGNVFFQQKRVGKNGKHFQMYKFRSMVSNADHILNQLLHLNEVNGAMFKMKEDPRVTRVGRFIRRTSLDELPQFLNVLKGEMSIVGPRPPLPREVERYSGYDKQRLQVTPGCTGLWQVSGRNSLDFNAMVELDLEYIRKRSIWLDIKLIFRTIKVLLGAKDAY